MDDDARAELRMLQARAYGPAPDIGTDAAAVARLAQLQALAAESRTVAAPATTAAAPSPEPTVAAPAVRRRSTPTPSPGPAPAPPTEAHPSPEPASGEPASGEPASGEPVDDAPAAPPAPRPWWRRTPVLWVASVVAAAVAGGLIAPAIVARAGEVATLAADPDGEVPAFLGTQASTAVVYEQFLGLTVVSGMQWGGEADEDCLGIVQTADIQNDQQSLSGPFRWGCGAGTFPVQVPVLVTSTAPEELLDRFAVGTSLQFELHGDKVIVRSGGVQPSAAPAVGSQNDLPIDGRLQRAGGEEATS